MGLVHSACAKPKHLFHLCGEDDVVRLAAALAYGIGTNHAFLQGNHRTAKTACIMFIEANGYRWTMEDSELLGIWVDQLISREIDEDEFAELLRPHVFPDPSDLISAFVDLMFAPFMWFWGRRQ